MIRYTAIRVVWIFIVLLTVLTLNFTLLKLAPAFPPIEMEARHMYFERLVRDGYMTSERLDDPEEIEQRKEECDDCWFVIRNVGFPSEHEMVYREVPVIVQYYQWLTGIITRWDWGVSTQVQPNVPIFDIMLPRIGVTMKLNFISLIFYIPFGFVLGIIAALRKNSIEDNVISLGVMIFISVPSFVVMLLLIMVFGYQLRWFPTAFPARDTVGFLHSGLVLPVFGLSVGAIAGLTRLTRAELTEVLTSEFLLLARTKGLTREQAVMRHAMRNSMVPLVPSIIGSFVGLLSGSIIIEIIYGIPGTSRIFLRAMERDNIDYNLVLAVTAFYTIIGLFAVLFVDLSYGIVDPRIRMGARK